MPIDMTPTAGDPGDNERPDEATQQQRAHPQADALKPNEIRLRDGRVVAMRKSSIDDDEAVLDLLGQEGKQLNNLAPQTIWRANALYSITHIGHKLPLRPEDAVMPPRTVDEMKGLRKLFDSLDGAALMEKWAEIQAGGGDFRSRG